ncbi:MAG TPA: M14 family zinc carboxypeptidase [Planctomycetota bacterium]
MHRPYERIPLLLLAASAAAGCAAPQPAGAVPGAPFAPIAAHRVDPGVAPAAWSTLGESREGRPLEALTIGAGEPRIYLIGGIHGNEREGAQLVDQLLGGIASGSGPAGTWRILRDLNPDGSAAARRTSGSSVDLNRNWPATNFVKSARHGPEPLSEPETAAVHADLLAFRPQLVVVLHSADGGPFVNFDGPARAYATDFAAAAEIVDPRWRVVADVGYPTPGSLGSWIGHDRMIPILTVEFRRGEDSPPARLAALEGLMATTRRVVGQELAR